MHTFGKEPSANLVTNTKTPTSKQKLASHVQKSQQIFSELSKRFRDKYPQNVSSMESKMVKNLQKNRN